MTHITQLLMRRAVVVVSFIFMLGIPFSYPHCWDIQSEDHKSRAWVTNPNFNATFSWPLRVSLKKGFYPMAGIKADSHDPTRFVISMKLFILSSYAAKWEWRVLYVAPFQKYSHVGIHLIHSILVYLVWHGSKSAIIQMGECCWSQEWGLSDAFANLGFG